MKSKVFKQKWSVPHLAKGRPIGYHVCLQAASVADTAHLPCRQTQALFYSALLEEGKPVLSSEVISTACSPHKSLAPCVTDTGAWHAILHETGGKICRKAFGKCFSTLGKRNAGNSKKYETLGESEQ